MTRAAQLWASRDQLRTGAAQLFANEDQLRTCVDQLFASEDQLRTCVDQLFANEDQLRAGVGLSSSSCGVSGSEGPLCVCDQLNTYKSESLVRFVAENCRIPQSSLGEEGKSGVLQSMATWKAFLTNPAHRIQIVYTFKHCSWLNQIECWFHILSRRLLHVQSRFTSVQQLEQKIKQFIAYYNQHLAKLFHWALEGKILHI